MDDSSYELLLRSDSRSHLGDNHAPRSSSGIRRSITDTALNDRDNILSASDQATGPALTPESRLRDSQRKGQLQGWRFGVVCCISASFAVLTLNSVLAIVAYIKLPRHQGLPTIYEGSCDVVSTCSVIIHAVINILGSVLLGASNYTMQCLAAPTRTDLDRAHAKGNWLDIGVPSVRNLAFHIPWKRMLLWWLLALSSLPVHLFYNSVVFKTVSASNYGMFTGPAFYAIVQY